MHIPAQIWESSHVGPKPRDLSQLPLLTQADKTNRRKTYKAFDAEDQTVELEPIQSKDGSLPTGTSVGSLHTPLILYMIRLLLSRQRALRGGSKGRILGYVRC